MTYRTLYQVRAGPVKSVRPENSGKVEKPGHTDFSNRPENSGRLRSQDSLNSQEKTEKSGHTDFSNRPENSGCLR